MTKGSATNEYKHKAGAQNEKKKRIFEKAKIGRSNCTALQPMFKIVCRKA